MVAKKRFLSNAGRCALALAVLAMSAAAQQAPALQGAGAQRRSGQAESLPYRLSLKEAIERGLQSHLRVRVAETRVEEAGGTRERRFAGLLPRARIESYASLQNRNLRAFGLSFPGAPEVVGPFSNYDFRVYAEQPVFDRQVYHAWKASGQQENSARQDLQDARDQIVRFVAALYLNAQSAGARERAVDSRVTLAEALLTLARDRREAGVATGVDVLRAQVQLSNEKQRQLEARNARQSALIALARNIGMSPGSAIELAEPLGFEAIEVPAVNLALQQAIAARADYLSLASQREAIEAQRRAARARYLPKLSIGGNYGGIGRSVGDVRGTGVIQGTVSMVVFDRDRQGEEAELDSRAKRIETQMADLRLGIEQEIRDALLVLDSAAQEVRVSREGRELAARELELARDRFQSGVTNNIEIVTAQDALARALENEILAATRHADARMSLARALGETEKNYARFSGTR